MVLKNNALKFFVAFLFLTYFTITDYLHFGSLFLILSRSFPILTLSTFIILQLTYFKRKTNYATTIYNGFIVSLLVMAYANILFMHKPEFISTVASRTILILAIVGLEARGNWITILLLHTIPTLLFFILAWLIELPLTYPMQVLYVQIVCLIILNTILAEIKNRRQFESFLREQKHIFEERKNLSLIKELQERNTQIEEQKKEIQAQKEEIATQYEEISSQRDFAERQRDMIISQKDELTDSIVYAKRIQEAMLPDITVLENNVKESMLLFMPKDIVSGDFYWATKVDHYLIFSVSDCTGHGVPGGFMSMLGISFLNEIVSKHKQNIPNLILHNLRETVIASLNQSQDKGSSHDGMDIAIGCIDLDRRKLYFSGANNSLLLFRNGDDEPIELKGDKMPVAIYPRMREFTLQSIDLFENDCIYLFSDGYSDQFGGPKGKKFMMRNFKRLLASIQQLSMIEQKQILRSTIKNWMKGHEKHHAAVNAQVDDITVLGIRV